MVLFKVFILLNDFNVSDKAVHNSEGLLAKTLSSYITIFFHKFLMSLSLYTLNDSHRTGNYSC